MIPSANGQRPLLVVDGDSFAHRSYHALPKTIRRAGDKGGGAILGFANFLLRLYVSEHPRAVLVGWDTLEESTYRHEALPAYQSGREFDDELVEQLEVLPEFVAACGFANAKAAGYEADDFLAAAAAKEERRGGTVVVATGDRDAYQLASAQTTIVQPIKAGEMARIGPAEVRERYSVEPHQVRFHRPAWRRIGQIPRRQRHRCQDCSSPVAQACLARRPHRRWPLPGPSRRAASLSQDRDHGPVRAASLLRSQKPTGDKASALARAWQLNRLADPLAILAR